MRRLCCLLLALLLLCGTACASTALMLTEPLIVDDEWKPVTEKGAYSAIRALGKTGLYACTKKEDGLTYLLNGEGEIVSTRGYTSVTCAQDRIILTANTYCALYDGGLNQLTPFVYRLIAPTGNGFFAFKSDVWDSVADRVYYLDADGTEYPTDNGISYAFGVKPGALIPVTDGKSGRMGYLTDGGQWALPAEFRSAGAFCGRLACASGDGGTGLIDFDGDWILKPEYDYIRLNGRFVCAVTGTKHQVFAVDGTRLTPVYGGPAGVTLMENGFVLQTENSTRLMNADGSLNTAFGVDSILYGGIGSGIIVSEYEGMYLYDMVKRITSDGFFSIQPLGGELYRTCAKESEDGDAPFLFGVMDADGNELLKARYESVAYVDETTVATRSEEGIFLWHAEDGKAEKLVKIEY